MDVSFLIRNLKSFFFKQTLPTWEFPSKKSHKLLSNPITAGESILSMNNSTFVGDRHLPGPSPLQLSPKGVENSLICYASHRNLSDFSPNSLGIRWRGSHAKPVCQINFLQKNIESDTFDEKILQNSGTPTIFWIFSISSATHEP